MIMILVQAYIVITTTLCDRNVCTLVYKCEVHFVINKMWIPNNKGSVWDRKFHLRLIKERFQNQEFPSNAFVFVMCHRADRSSLLTLHRHVCWGEDFQKLLFKW